jgi:glycosyltransferase involved in cell wall biosynthesis
MKQPVTKVDALITLYHSENAGGHVKCWQCFAEAAAATPELDLTVYFLGERHETITLNDHSRITTFRPVLGNRWLCAGNRTNQTDLAPFHPALARALRRDSIWHITDTFSFGLTARLLAGRRGRPLVASHHTDLAKFIKIYSRQILENKPGGPFLLDKLHLGRYLSRLARTETHFAWKGCRHIFTANDSDFDEAAELPGASATVSNLNSGTDIDRFNPNQCDRTWLKNQFGIPEKRPVVTFAGRLDATKGIMLLARAIKQLNDNGRDVQLLAAGIGPKASAIRELLGDRATLTGFISQTKLARAFASTEIFGFPSKSETKGNVVSEAMASGLPPMLANNTATNQWLNAPGKDGMIVEEQTADAWTTALQALLEHDQFRRSMGCAARRTIETAYPSWEQTLKEDLLPVWRKLSRHEPDEQKVVYAN